MFLALFAGWRIPCTFAQFKMTRKSDKHNREMMKWIVTLFILEAQNQIQND